MKQLATQFVAALLLAMASASVWGNDNNVNVADESDYSVLVFWASWCGRCDAVLKDMDALHMSGALHGIPVKAVNIGAQANAAQALLRKGGQDLQLIADGQTLAERFGVQSVPWVVVVDANGEPVYEPSRNTVPTQLAKYVQMDLALRL